MNFNVQKGNLMGKVYLYHLGAKGSEGDIILRDQMYELTVSFFLSYLPVQFNVSFIRNPLLVTVVKNAYNNSVWKVIR